MKQKHRFFAVTILFFAIAACAWAQNNVSRSKYILDLSIPQSFKNIYCIYDTITVLWDGNNTDRIKFEKNANFISCLFQNKADFSSTVFKDQCSFARSRFQFNAGFSDARFWGYTSFEHTIYDKNVFFDSARFNDGSRFDMTVFN